MDILSLLKVDWTERKLVIAVPNQTLWARVEKKRELLLAALKKYCGKLPEVEFIPPPTQAQPVSEDAFKQCAQLPEIALCKEILGAVLTECYPVDAPH